MSSTFHCLRVRACLGCSMAIGNKWVYKTRTSIWNGSDYLVIGMLSFSVDGKLYGGTYPQGQLWSWDGSEEWTLCAPQLGTSTWGVCLCEYNGKIYGGMGQGVIPYTTGKLYEWSVGATTWTLRAPMLTTTEGVRDLIVYNSHLYASTGDTDGRLLMWDDVSAFVLKASKLGSEVTVWRLCVFNNKLYGGTSPNSNLYEWNDVNAWVSKAGKFSSETDIRGLCEYNGNLYGSTGPNGCLVMWDGVSAWVQKAASLGSEMVIRLHVYAGRLFGCTSLGRLLRWDNVSAWEVVAERVGPEGQILNLEVHDGKLFGATIGSARLVDWTVGPQDSSHKGYDRGLGKDCLLDLPMFEGIGAASLMDVAKPHHPVLMTHAPVWTQLSSGLWVLNFTAAHPDYLSIVAAGCTDLNFTTESFSGVCWTQFVNSGLQRQHIMGKGSGFGGTTGWTLYWNTQSQLCFRSVPGAVSESAQMANAVHLCGFTRVGASVRMYVDSSDRTSTAGNHGATITSAAASNFLVAVYEGLLATTAFNGQLGLSRIWNRALSPAEHREIFNRERHLFGV